MSRLDRILKEYELLKIELDLLRAKREELTANLRLFRALRDETLETRFMYQEIHRVSFSKRAVPHHDPVKVSRPNAGAGR